MRQFQPCHRHDGPGRERGFTLIEFIVVAVLIALALIGILSYVSRAQAAREVQTEVKALSYLMAAARGERLPAGAAGALRPERMLIQRHQTPPSMRAEGCPTCTRWFSNQWGGQVTVQINMPDHLISIRDHVPLEYCAAVVTAMVNAHPAMVSISAGNRTAQPDTLSHASDDSSFGGLHTLIDRGCEEYGGSPVVTNYKIYAG